MKQGGKLSKQLAEQKRQNPMQSDSNELPERMVVSIIRISLYHSNLIYYIIVGLEKNEFMRTLHEYCPEFVYVGDESE